jgi:hypothetical protein
VLVEPGRTPVPLERDRPNENAGSTGGYLVFGGMAALVLGIGALALARARRAAPRA